ncbi:kinase-like protein, partial [Ceratobasidium sp. AG-I]
MYAVKVMRCAPPGSRQRAFQAREVALHRRADGHPGVVPLHALVYMVLSYVGGGDLFTLIAEQQLYIGRDELVTSVFMQLIDAVAWCHERGVRHRDLKPENVLCEEGGKVVYVSDFGLATTERWSRDFGCGSSYYMSPDPLTPATSPNYDTLANDVWTLGVVLVNLSTGRNPWEAASPLDATFTSFCADPANFLPTILPISGEANAVLVRVFERDQAKRCSLAELKEMVLSVKRWTLR